MMKISEINLFPVKSLGGISVASAAVESRGFRFDRRWMLVDKRGKFLTQREFPRMATIGVEADEEGLKFSCDGATIEVAPLPTEGVAEMVEVWGSFVRGLIYEDVVNEWFASALGTNCRLAAMPETTRRKVDPEYAVTSEDQVSFADGYPFLLIGQASLDDLNTRLDQPVPMNRFRPNLVVEGAAPYAEDEWKKIRIGETVFHVIKPCARCVMTTVDQATGKRPGPEPLSTLANYRKVEGKVLFGQNLIAATEGGVIRVGDEVESLS